MITTTYKSILIVLIVTIISSEIFAQWQWVNPYPSNSIIEDCHFLDENVGYCVGVPATVLKTTDGGRNWEFINPLNHNRRIFGVSFIDASTGCIGGDRVILRTTDGGSNWDTVYTDGMEIYSIKFVSNNIGYATGFRYYQIPTPLVLKTTDGGKEWFSVSPDTVISGVSSIRNSFFYNENLGWGVTDRGGIFKTTDGGENWVYQIHESSIAPLGRAIYFVSDKVGWATRTHNGIFKTINGGENWEYLSTPESSVYDIYFFDNDRGYICGFNGLYQTTDGGLSWTEIIKNTSEREFYSISFPTPNIGYVVGNDYQFLWRNYIFNTTDAGDNWTNLILKPFTQSNLTSGYFINDDVGWIASNEIFKTFDGGNSWEKQLVNQSAIKSLFFLSEDNGWGVSSNGTILKTDDGGNHWNYYPIVDTSDLTSIYFIDNNNGFISGDSGTFLKTIDGGENWSKINLDFYGDLRKIYFCEDSNNGYVLGDSSTLFQTFDKGLSWEKKELDALYELNSIYFNGSDEGWLLGYNKLLYTTDAGNSWSLHNIANNAVGKDIIFFNNEGYILDKSSIYHSSDNGSTWELLNYLTLSEKLNSFFSTENYLWIFGGRGQIIKYSNFNAVTNIEHNSHFKNLDFSLSQNYPNPFNPTTTISYQIPEFSFVKLKIYDILGREIAILVNEEKGAGKYEIEFDAIGLSSGVYIYQIKTKDYIETKKLLLLK